VKEYDSTINIRLSSTYTWAIQPRQADPTAEIEWEEFKTTGDAPIAERASSKFEKEWAIRPTLGGIELRKLLDQYLWNERDHVSVDQLGEWFCRYLYLPRLTARTVLEKAVQDGASLLTPEETFAVAAAFDDAKKRYSGLRIGQGLPVVERTTLLVKTPVARAQREPSGGPKRPPSGEIPVVHFEGTSAPLKTPVAVVPKLAPNAFDGSVKLDPARVVKDTGRVVQEVLEHLSTLTDADVEVTLELRVRVPDGIKDDVVRTVSENAKALKFQVASFRRE
jgi:hypothetical protein